MMKSTRVIGFDADDTLWVNENYYRVTEKRFAELLSDFGGQEFILKELFSTEMQNLKFYGYGVKPFVISMIETALRVTDKKVHPDILEKIILMGRGMLEEDVELLPDVKEVLDSLYGKYKLIVATKGDLLDQERKLNKSSLSCYFHHIEVMSDKTVDSYRVLLKHLEIEPDNFIMIGNSLRSDILPPYELGCTVIHVPYELTWIHEMNVEEIPQNKRFYKVEKLVDILQIIEI